LSDLGILKVPQSVRSSLLHLAEPHVADPEAHFPDVEKSGT